MNDRERLIELIGSTEYGFGSQIGRNFKRSFIGLIADSLIKGGVTVQKHGRWENTKFLTTGDGRVRVGDCSSCKSIERVTSYCPNCGAKMAADA